MSKFKKSDWLQGQCSFTDLDGAKYAGVFKNGNIHGYGTLTTPDGDKFEGEFRRGHFHGEGTYTSPDDQTYVGEWKDWNYHGQGTHIFFDSDGKIEQKYVGEWKDGERHGQGTQSFNDAEEYVGEWREDIQHGLGTWSFNNGMKYEGEFQRARFHGQGTLINPDGSSYVGEWKNGSRHGQGTSVSSDGTKYVGVFKNNEQMDTHVSRILAGENKTTEFKETFTLETTTKKKEKYLIEGKIKTIAGFLNTSGGILFIGVNDASEIVGIDEEIDLLYKSEDKFLRYFKDIMKSAIGSKFIPLVDFTIEEVQGKRLLIVSCKRSLDGVYINNNKDFYTRTGPSTEKLEGQALVAYATEHFSPSRKT